MKKFFTLKPSAYDVQLLSLTSLGSARFKSTFLMACILFDKTVTSPFFPDYIYSSAKGFLQVPSIPLSPLRHQSTMKFLWALAPAFASVFCGNALRSWLYMARIEAFPTIQRLILI